LALATGVAATALVIVLAFVLASPRRSEPTSPVDTVAQRPGEPPANTETEAEKPRSEPFVAETVTASEAPTFSPPSEPNPEGARTGEPVDSQLPAPTMAVPATPVVPPTAPPRSPVVVVERIEPVPVPAQQPGVVPVTVPSAELAKTTAPPPPPVETLEQADRRLQQAVEQASSSAEHQAVAQELLSLADKAILDSQTELAKQVVERALAAARKSESDGLVKQATLLWGELEQPLTDEVKERARQRLGERRP